MDAHAVRAVLHWREQRGGGGGRGALALQLPPLAVIRHGWGNSLAYPFAYDWHAPLRSAAAV